VEIYDVEELLYGTHYEPFIGSLQKISLKNYTYDNLFKMGNEKLGYFAIKIRKHNEKNVKNSYSILCKVNDSDNLIHKNIGIIEKGMYIITVSDWLNGKQPIDNNRDLLPLFFSKLAVFNKNNISKGPYTSMYLDLKYFDNIVELIDWEIKYNNTYLPKNIDAKIIMEVLETFKRGISCVINEDMNCGNMFITNNGECKILDTEWLIYGLNLYQFQHFDYFGFEEKTWHKITDEALECYNAYFKSLGICNNEANEQIRAVELLNILRQNTYWKYSGIENDKEIERRIKIVLEKEKYI
jgi:hypothetical protein